jgi:hypothetical protein
LIVGVLGSDSVASVRRHLGEISAAAMTREWLKIRRMPEIIATLFRC